MRTANEIALALAEAVEREDIEQAEAQFAALRETGEIPTDLDLATRGIFGLERLKDRGPIIPDPNLGVRKLRTALDNGDPDEARTWVLRLRQSMNAGGPHPDTEHKRLLCMQIIRRGVWEVSS